VSAVYYLFILLSYVHVKNRLFYMLRSKVMLMFKRVLDLLCEKKMISPKASEEIIPNEAGNYRSPVDLYNYLNGVAESYEGKKDWI